MTEFHLCAVTSSRYAEKSLSSLHCFCYPVGKKFDLFMGSCLFLLFASRRKLSANPGSLIRDALRNAFDGSAPARSRGPVFVAVVIGEFLSCLDVPLAARLSVRAGETVKDASYLLATIHISSNGYTVRAFPTARQLLAPHRWFTQRAVLYIGLERVNKVGGSASLPSVHADVVCQREQETLVR